MAAVSGLFILDQKGKIIISRDFRGELGNANIIETFQKNVIDIEDPMMMKPVFYDTTSNLNFAYVFINNVYICCICRQNSNIMLMYSFIYKLIDIFKNYFKDISEEIIKDNFVCIYELLDEVIDGGYPQSTEYKVLKEYIKNQANTSSGSGVSMFGSNNLILSQLSSSSSSTPSTSSSSSALSLSSSSFSSAFASGLFPSTTAVKPPSAITHAVSWRTEGIYYKKNEIFLDVVEKLNLLVTANGTILRTEILGSIKMKSFLSGMPELKLGLNDKLCVDVCRRVGLNGGNSNSVVEMEDIKFHQCVRLHRFKSDRTISFIPPDGEFELMSYRLSPSSLKPLILLECCIDRNASETKLEYMIKAKSQFKARSIATGVQISIPVPSDVDTPQFQASVGSIRYLLEQDLILWNIKQFQGQRDLILHASFGLPTIQHKNKHAFMRRPISVAFEIPYFTVSGITVKYLKIIEKSGYQALPWVRYITQNGDYQLRLT